ncbi:hypothetical protein F3Y22_tig00111207pilonHSYRG00069 [Hibiscus syriacus]|uniref:Uncharacterized protein n=1 Tax=Hibiscus syriacus TaxID=106335 RepID=A0A6A2YVR4_HIBSY|nr:hypothetical protein F3Y22_tig00111207pilonHSYRG00069 [Hibiscus syriacus]
MGSDYREVSSEVDWVERLVPIICKKSDSDKFSYDSLPMYFMSLFEVSSTSVLIPIQRGCRCDKLERLEINKSVLVADFLGSVYSGGFNWSNAFSRIPLECKCHMVEELKKLVNRVKVIRGKVDKIEWLHDKERIFSVKKLPLLIVDADVEDPEFEFDKIWKLFVPLEVKNFLWMLKIHRLPTKVFLLNRDLEVENMECSLLFVWCGSGGGRSSFCKLFFHRLPLGFRYLVVESSWGGALIKESVWWNNPMDCLSGACCPAGSVSAPVEFGWWFSISGVAKAGWGGCEGCLRSPSVFLKALFSGPSQENNIIGSELVAIKLSLDVFLEAAFEGVRSWWWSPPPLYH